MIYGRLLAAGRSYEQIDDMCMADVEMIFDHWRDYPTADMLLRAFFDVKPPPDYDAPPPEGCLSIAELRVFAHKHRHLAGRKD
jgi:hypothetical protein